MIKIAFVIGFVCVRWIIIIIILFNVIRTVVVFWIICLLYLIRLGLGYHALVAEELIWATLHASPIDLCIVLQCKLNKSCIMSL